MNLRSGRLSASDSIFTYIFTVDVEYFCYKCIHFIGFMLFLTQCFSTYYYLLSFVTPTCFCRTPTLYRLINDLTLTDKNRVKSKTPAVISLLCKLANIHNQQLNAYQKMVGFMLRTSGTSKDTINKLSALHDTVSYSTITTLIDGYAEECRRSIAEWADETVVQVNEN